MARTRMSSQDREVQLLDVAEKLFARHGYENVSIEDVARAAGVTRPLVYQHHGSKEGLLLACVRRAMEDFNASLVAAEAGSGGDLATFVESGGALIFDLMREQPGRWSLLFGASVGGSGHLADELSLLRSGSVTLLCDLARPYAPGIDDEQLDAFANAVSGISEAFGHWWRRNPHIPRERVLGYYRDFITSAITAAMEQRRAS